MNDDARDAVTLPEIVIADYDPDWPAQFEAERARLAGALRGLSVAFEHIGSTAVPGLAAKPVIDILVGVERPTSREDCIRPVESLGYVHRGEAGVPGRLFFRRGNPRSHHVHVVDVGGEVWRRTIVFRDYLRTHPDAAQEYAAAKRELARLGPQRYSEAKAPVVEAILARARLWANTHLRLLIADYDSRWPGAFEAERRRIVEALGPAMDGVVAIEHMGSTAVPGCAAKPIIDIMIGVRPLAVGERCIAPLERLGYEYMGEYGIPGRFYFRKGEPRSHHIHLVEHGCDFWQRHLAFRDALRSRPDLVGQYSALKRALAGEHGADRVGYTDAKTPFVEGVIAATRGADRP